MPPFRTKFAENFLEWKWISIKISLIFFLRVQLIWNIHYCDAIMGTVASQITSLTIVYTTVYSDADQSKHQSSASLAFVWGIHRGPVNSPHKWPVTRKMFPFDDVIMHKDKRNTPDIFFNFYSSIGSNNRLAPIRLRTIISEPMMVSLLTHICVTRLQWVNTKTLVSLYR